MNADLACGSCSRRLSEMRGPCLTCGRDAEGIRRDAEQRIEPLLHLHAALTKSTHIYAEYERSLVENELRGYGVCNARARHPRRSAPGKEESDELLDATLLIADSRSIS